MPHSRSLPPDTAPGPSPARWLLRSTLHDPQCLPENLAAFAVRRFGPTAARSVAGIKKDHPDMDAAGLHALVIARGWRATVSEGAFVGGPFLIFVPVAFCAALLSQARTVLELAALKGGDPTADDRAAELLVLQGVHENVGQARDALAACHRKPAATGKRSALRRPAVLWYLTLRMARVLGLLTASEHTGWSHRLVQACRWLLLGLVFLVGIVAPLIWMPYMAMSYHQATTRLTDRATAFYFTDSAPVSRRRSHLDPSLIAGAARTLLSLLLPVVLVVVTLLTGVRIADSNWPVVGIVLFIASVAVGAVWHWRRRGRRKSGG
ncbi:hypothetical protein ACFRU3_45705 [Streptomyces sp. NPDC056910]|uniref:hypothetical protein n=1 Tax=Streptomyces sp. NPDC056910 TaxID=3345964 RepID=UPI003687F640